MEHIKKFEKYIDNEDNRDWVVTCYDGEDEIIAQWTIKDRTEHQAEHEAEPDFPKGTEDWSLMPKKFWDDIKKKENKKKKK